MSRVSRLASLAFVSLAIGACVGVHQAEAQYFGRNKVEYVDFDFKVLATEHFDVYHYPGEEVAARLAARLAERWYTRLSRELGHEMRGRQPLILYANQPEFAQTNVIGGFLGEGIGGVTESSRRRIVMPFAPTLAETDQVLGHEIAHAFQFDMIRKYGGHLGWPGWFIEGMAQYLSIGGSDVETAMWLRDAVIHRRLPAKRQAAERQHSPYRYGHAFWAYLGGRFGDSVMGDILKARKSGSLLRRVRDVTGTTLDGLYADWRSAADAQYGAPDTGRLPAQVSSLVLGPSTGTGSVHLGPALSPDGERAAFFSEKDRLSLDLYAIDLDGGASRKLATTAASDRFESLQAIRSSGAWSAEGARLVFSVVAEGKPALIVRDMHPPGREQEFTLPQLGQILSPSFSPDGHTVAFAALNGGVTDLYVYDLDSRALRRLTDDAFADLQPTWSPDGTQLVFATDRFTSDLSALRFGRCELALLDVASGAVHPVPGLLDAKHLNPHWSADGRSVFFISDPSGVNNVYRLDLASGEVFQVTRARSGVAGLASSSPALSVASHAPALAFVAYRNGKYDLDILRGAAALHGIPATELTAAAREDATRLPPAVRADDLVDRVLRDPAIVGAPAAAAELRGYQPDLALESLGQPYVSSGGGPFGTFVRGGGSLLFGDLLGERKLGASIQVGNHLRDLAVAVRYLNRERRWNWGAIAELEPSIRRLPGQQLDDVDGARTLTVDTQYYQRIQGRVAGLLAYPLSHTRRIEFSAGVRHARYRHDVRSKVFALPRGTVVSESLTQVSDAAPATVGEVSAAFVGDTSAFGATSPILGSRYRFEITPTAGDLTVARVLLDYRRYLMPVKPYTIAMRFMHLGQYGPDSDDARLLPTFLGSRQFVHGYGWSSIKCQWSEAGECSALGELLGSRLVVGNLELRVPLRGMFSRELKYGYGPLAVEGFVFSDNGLVWGRQNTAGPEAADRRLVSSVGAGIRLNAGGFPLELVALRALSAPARGWSFDFSFRGGF